MQSSQLRPLTEAAAAGDMEEVNRLLVDSAAINMHDSVVQDKFYAMRTAVEKDYRWIVYLLLARGVKPSPFDFCTAVKNRSYTILELMLHNGFDINAAYRDEYPPFWADALNDSEMVRWLVQRGADPNVPSIYGITPFTMAVQSASRQTIKLLLELGASVQHGYPLHSAVWNNREDEVVELLLTNGASPNTIEFKGQPRAYYDVVTAVGTPLHVAYRVGNHRLVRLLLEYGADPNIRDARGMLPIQVHKLSASM